MRTFCSGEWKREVDRRYVRGLGYGPEGRSERGPVVNWLGISRDEIDRLSGDRVRWMTTRWPLVFDRPTTRAECVRLVEAHGWPRPPKSSCWCCPFRGDRQWRELREAWPEDWARAVALEAELRERDAGLLARRPFGVLHRSGVPLAEAALDGGAQDASGPGCQSGFCFV